MRQNPAPFTSGYSVVIVANEKGGVGKSTLASYIGCAASLEGASCMYFEIDDQQRLQVLTGSPTVRIKMPNDEMILVNDQAVNETLDPLFTAVCSPQKVDLIIIDVGANTDLQFLQAAQMLGIDKDAKDAGQSIAFVIPITGSAECVSAGLRTAKRSKIAFPSADIQLSNMFFARDGVIAEQLSESNKEYRQLCELATTCFNFEALRPRTLHAFESMSTSLSSFAQMSKELISDRSGLPLFTAKSVHTQFMLHFVKVVSEVRRSLRFQR